MLVHHNPLFALAFGNQITAYDPKKNRFPSLKQEPWHTYSEYMPLQKLVTLKQAHSTNGIIITHDTIDTLPTRGEPLSGDYLITNQPHIGIGILTADCLPIVIYDSLNHVIATIHAGYRGTLAGIAPHVLTIMHELFNTHEDHVTLFFGPCAHVCCYEIGADVANQIPEERRSYTCIQHNDRMYFDLPRYNRCALEEVGIAPEAIHETFSSCTMCDSNFCSYRRDKTTLRQLTVATIK